MKAKGQPIAGAYRTRTAQMRDLDKLNRAYERHRGVIVDWYLQDQQYAQNNVNKYSLQIYGVIPFTLCAWRPKTSELIMRAYPELVPVIRIIEGLVEDRKRIVSMPVIK